MPAKESEKQKNAGETILQDFPKGTDYQLRGFSDLLALRDCLVQQGVQIDWNDLLGYTGDAFGCDGIGYYSFRMHDVMITGARVYGFEHARWVFGSKVNPFADIRSTIEQGNPCIVGGMFCKASSCLYTHAYIQLPSATVDDFRYAFLTSS